MFGFKPLINNLATCQIKAREVPPPSFLGSTFSGHKLPHPCLPTSITRSCHTIRTQSFLFGIFKRKPPLLPCMWQNWFSSYLEIHSMAIFMMVLQKVAIFNFIRFHWIHCQIVGFGYFLVLLKLLDMVIHVFFVLYYKGGKSFCKGNDA